MENKKGEIRQIILGQIEDLEEDDQAAQEHRKTVGLDQQAVGRVSRVDALQQQAMALAQSARRQSAIKELKNALARLEDENFGYCEDCDEEIEDIRIKANPSIRLCLDCQRG